MLGLSVLVLGATELSRAANLPGGGNANDWVAPMHPGDAPDIPAGATAAASSRIVTQWEREVKEFQQHLEAENTLKQLTLTGVNSDCIVSLSDPLCGHANIAVRQTIEHLETRCSALDQDMLTKILEDLQQPWGPAVSMEPLWQCAIIAQQVAAHGCEPVSDTMLVCIFRQIMINTGLFTLDLCDWDKKLENAKTWAEFKIFFVDANKTRINEATVEQLQHGALGAVTRPGSRPGGPAVTPSHPGTPSSCPGAPVNCSTSASPVTMPGLADFGCCWSHGFIINVDHNCISCTNKAHGHQGDVAI